jgi:hypothetical protein
MNFFKIKTSWSNAEFIVLKLAIASAYLLIGAYFSVLILDLFFPIIFVFVVTLIWSVYLWVKKMKDN